MICLLHNYSASSGQFKNRVYFSLPLKLAFLYFYILLQLFSFNDLF